MRLARPDCRLCLELPLRILHVSCAVANLSKLPDGDKLTSLLHQGDEASLGILSAWEPCGAILCANLPHIYRHLVLIKDKIQSTVKSVTHSKSGATASSSERRGGGYKGSLQHHDWAKINNSDGLSGGTGGETVTEVIAQPTTMSVELDELKSGGIMVSRAFTQSSAHDLLSAAAAVAAPGDKIKD